MSFAETAELAVRLKLDQAAYMRGMAQATAATNKFGSTAGAIGGHLKSGLGSALTNLTKIGLVAGAAIGAGLAVQVRAGFDALTRLEEVTAQTNAVLKSTKGAAGESAAAIVALSEKYEDLNATIDNKVIQSGENLLLTFTSIRKDAFEPALKAALDMNQAMGGGEGGLQGTIIQVGKALQDPIKGLTALRRVGVNFSEQQQTQIKDLIKHNKLYEAQQLILKELTKEFGGSFAAAGKTAAGTFASLGDAVEDIQMNLTRALLPALTEVAKELTKVAKDPAFLRGVEDFGKGLAGAFRNAVAFAKQLPWKEIGDGLRAAAGFAGTLVQKFADAPDWLKTAVITGWGLNKLTGGALTGIGGEIAKGIGGQFLSRGASPANPLWVQSVTGGIPGGGGPGGLGPASLIGAAGLVVAAQGVANSTIPNGGNAYNLPITPSGFGPNLLDINQIAANKRKGGASAPDFAAMSQWSAQVAGDFGRIDQTAKTFNAGVHEMAMASRKAADTIEKDWLKKIDPEDIAGRSKAKSGHAATPAQIAAIRSKDLLFNVQTILNRSKASSDTKLERLRVLAADAKAHGDTRTATKIQSAIDKMKADIKAAQGRTTSAVVSGADKVASAIAANGGSRSDLNVYVTTNVTTNSITRKIQTVARYGNTGGDRRYDP